MKRRKGAFISILLLLLFVATHLSIFKVSASSVNEKEFQDTLLFKKEYLSFPTWKRKWTKDLGWAGEVETKVFFSLGNFYVKLPVTLNASYDTTISPGETNSVELAADTYNGDGLEFEFTIGFNASITWSTLLGDVGVGDFFTGFDWEGDFTPPLGEGEHECTSSDGAAAPIGAYKVVSLDVGVDIRFKIEGLRIYGGCWLDDDYCDLHDSPQGFLISSRNAYSPQFSIEHLYDFPTQPYDGYVDFGLKNLFYRIKYTVQVAPTIGLSAAGVSWSYTFDYWIDLFSIEDDIPLAGDKSDDTTYQMTRELGAGLEPECGIALLDIGKVFISAKLGAGISHEGIYVTVEIKIQIRLIILHPASLSFDDTVLNIICENGTATTWPISSADFYPANQCHWITVGPLTLMEPHPGRECHNLDFSLNVPTITTPEDYYVKVDQNLIPTPSARLMFSYDNQPNLDIQRLGLTVLDTSPLPLNMYEINATIKNTGANSSLATDARLWLYEGVPAAPTADLEALIDQSEELTPPQPVPPLPPDGETTVVFNPWDPDTSWTGKNATFIVVVDKNDIVPEQSEVNNGAFTTAYIMDKTHDVAVTALSGVPSTIQKGNTINNIQVTIKNEGTVTENSINVNVYANEEFVDSDTASLSSEQSIALGPFSWTPPDKGFYIISAKVDRVDGENDTLDNSEIKVVTVYEHDRDVGVVDVTLSESEAFQNTNLTVKVIVANLGTVAETFDVSTYYDGNSIGTQQVSGLIPGGSETLSFTWDITTVTPGVYTIEAQASIVPSEGDTSDNSFTDGSVNVKPLPNIALTAVSTSRTVAFEGYDVDINITATVKNQGDSPQTFNIAVTFYIANTSYPLDTALPFYNTYTFHPFTTTVIDLSAGEERNITLAWNTRGLSKGSYTVAAFAYPAPGEANTTDNSIINGQVHISMVGDITGSDGRPDGKVDMRDVGTAARAFGSYPGHPGWNPDADVTGPESSPDNKVDMRDIGLIARHFGEEDP